MSEIGRKVRPVLVLTRSEVLDVRALVTVAEITTTARGLAAEVELDSERVGLEQPSVVNGDGLHTVTRSSLTRRVGAVDDATMQTVCWAVNYGLGC
ncbi:type II toxin-antitoxin system PemK/MazF family toxin [soil metagenome]